MNSIQVQSVPALHGWLWLRQGFSLFRLAPMQLLLLVLVLKTVANLLPALGLPGVVLAKILMPSMIVCFLSLLRLLAPHPQAPPPAPPVLPAAPGGRPPRVSFGAVLAWARNRQALQTMLLLGVLGLAIDFGALYLSGFQSTLENLAASAQDTSALPNDEQALASMLAPLAQSFILFLAITLPCYLFLWYVPVFGGLHGLPLLKSIVFSIIAVWRNMLAFICYAISLMLLIILSITVTQILSLLLGGGSGLSVQSMLLFLLLPPLLAVIGGSHWACYLDTITLSNRQPAAHTLPPADDAEA